MHATMIGERINRKRSERHQCNIIQSEQKVVSSLFKHGLLFFSYLNVYMNNLTTILPSFVFLALSASQTTSTARNIRTTTFHLDFFIYYIGASNKEIAPIDLCVRQSIVIELIL